MIWATAATVSILHYAQITQPFLAYDRCLKLRKTTIFMVFKTRPKKKKYHPLRLMINGKEFEQVTEFNFLGIIIDEKLNCLSHTTKNAKTISQAIGTLNKIKRFLPMRILKMFYISLILPKLHYGLLLWNYNNDSIFKIQKKAVRIISNNIYNAHTEPIFKDLIVPKLQDMVTLKTFSFYHKHTHKELPQYTQQFSLTTNKNIRSHNTKTGG